MSQALALSLFGLISLSLPVHAQSGSTPGISFGNSLYGGGTSTLRNPLVPGASFSLPYLPPAQGALPPIGSGFVPFPVTPGMNFLPPTTIPWTNGTAGNSYSQPTNTSVAPANQIDLPSNQISLPVSNYSALPPGALNSQVRGSIPHGPSTPGADPGSLRPPSFNNGSAGASANQNHESAAVQTSVDQNGQLPDLLTGIRANQRDARQHSEDNGLKRTASGYRLKGQSWDPQKGSIVTDLGMGVKALQAKNLAGNKLPLQTSFDSPRAGNPGNRLANFAGAQQTSDLDGIPMVNKLKITTDKNKQVSIGPPDPQTTIANQ